MINDNMNKISLDLLYIVIVLYLHQHIEWLSHFIEI